MSEDGHSLSARVFHTLREEILSGNIKKMRNSKKRRSERNSESAGHRCGKP